MKNLETAVSFLLFFYVISGKSPILFCYSIKGAHLNKPFPMVWKFVFRCLKLSAFHWKQMCSRPAFWILLWSLFMFPAMAGSILSASTFGVPLLTYLRNRISCFKFPKEPFAWMPRFSWKGRLHPWGFVPNLPVCISGRSWQPGVSLFFLLKVFYSDSLWYIRFYRGICCSFFL